MSYRHLSNKELLRHISNRKGLSPLIDELCERIEKLETSIEHSKPVTPNRNMDFSCVVCGASNNIKYPVNY